MSLRPDRKTLGNSIRILSKRMPSNPFVAFTGSLWAGAASEEKRGVAEFTSRLLLSGTKTRKASQIAEAIEKLGATLDFRNGEEALYFFGRCPRDATPKLLGIMVDCMSNPTFPTGEIERVRGEIIDDIKIDMDDTGRTAVRTLLQTLYPNHFYGRDPRGEEANVKRVKRSDTVSFHSDHFGPKGMIVAFSGDVDEKFINKKVAPILSGFEGEGERPILPLPAPAKKAKKVTPMPHKSQVDIAVGMRAIPRSHKHYYALSMANLLFGQIGLMGRLGRNIRDEQGLAYYSYSTLNCRTVGGHLGIAAGVNPNNLQKAVDGVRNEIERLHAEPLTQQEISDGKDNQIGSLKVALERNAEMAAEMYRIEYYGLGLDYLERFPGIVRDLTTEQIHKAARKYIRPENCSLSVAGPVTKNVRRSLKWS